MKKLAKPLVIVFTLLMLAGCVKTPPPAAYPAITPMDTAGMTLDSAQYGGVKVSFPSEEWVFDSSLASLAIYNIESLGTNQAYNINVQVVGEAPGTLDEGAMEQLIGEMDAYKGYITIDGYGLYTLYDEPVILTESTLQFTDTYIDEMIKLGGITEEQIEDMGGREVLLSIPPTTQVTLYAIVDGYMYIYVGTYYTEEQKQAVLDCMTVLVANTEKA